MALDFRTLNIFSMKICELKDNVTDTDDSILKNHSQPPSPLLSLVVEAVSMQIRPCDMKVTNEM